MINPFSHSLLARLGATITTIHDGFMASFRKRKGINRVRIELADNDQLLVGFWHYHGRRQDLVTQYTISRDEVEELIENILAI